jgi:exodeoxyribonuclease V beta subunit
MVTRLREMAASAPGRISVERSTLDVPTRWSPPLPDGASLSAAEFTRALDRGWRRTSFSDITAGVYDARVASEPEETLRDDEPAAPRPSSSPSDASAAAGTASSPGADGTSSPAVLRGMPVGARIGTFVHDVLEAADFAAADLPGELAGRVAEAQARRGVEVEPAEVVAGLEAALSTPLGPLVGDLRLRDLRRADRLDELVFELPLVGGDEPTGRLTLDAIARVLTAHLPADDPLAGYAERLRDPTLRDAVRGYLTGTLDLVMRLDGGRFAVVDYKTNWLAGPDEPLTAWHHRPAALAAEMRRAHYGLQAILYVTALHRYLRWRLSGYDPDRHLAGVLYLFVRGMTGPDVPRVDGAPCGVFAWRPPGALVTALSDALDGGA